MVHLHQVVVIEEWLCQTPVSYVPDNFVTLKEQQALNSSTRRIVYTMLRQLALKNFNLDIPTVNAYMQVYKNSPAY